MRVAALSLALLAAASGSAHARGALMQAAVIEGARVVIQNVPRPTAAAGQALIRIHYAAVNPADWQHPADSLHPAPGAQLPAGPSIPGYDGSGVIDSVGPGVTRFKPGEAVIVWSRARGTYAQFVAVPVNTLALKPDSLSFAQAAGVAHAGVAAWNMLIDVAKVQPGQTVLVLGGAGGVGSAAVQIAHNAGAHVIATASARNIDYLRSIGADQVIDYTRQQFDAQLSNVDIAINTVDIDNAYRGLAVLKKGGHLVSVGGLPSAQQCAARGIRCASPTPAGTPIGVALKQLTAWSQAGKYQVSIDQTFALTDVLKAWEYSEKGHTRGKSVIHVAD
jgi:NADPH:quinone reductase-like Zn-dependent oxidoreductase